MKSFFVSLASVFILIIAMIPTLKADNIEIKPHMDSSVETWMNRYDIPGVGVSIIDSDEVVYSNTFGYMDQEHQQPLTDESILRTESISKTVTAYLVMVLVEQDVLNLNTPVSDYIDIDIPEEVTLHLLLTHQAGLDIGPFTTHFNPSEDMPSLREHLIETIKFISEPGTKFSYSNVSYNIIQYVIESVTGKSFNEVMKEEIFNPFQTSQASFEYDSSMEEQYAIGYEVDGDRVEPYIYPEQASGGLFTNLSSITNLIQNMMGRTDVLSSSYQAMLYEKHTDVNGEYGLVSDGYGYGNFIEENETKAVFHGGQGHGWMAFYYAVPSEKSAIVIITNSQRSYPMISGLVDDFTLLLGYESAGISVIQSSLTYMTAIVILLAIFILFVTYKMVKQAVKQPTKKSKKTRIHMAVTLVLLVVTAYLWLTPYIFIQVLYPIHYVFLRLELTLITLVMIGYNIYKLIQHQKQKLNNQITKDSLGGTS